jgi:predicted aldo/keto reductase-like oxidoreductase
MKIESQEKSRISRRGFLGVSVATLAGLGAGGRNKLFGESASQASGAPKIREYRTLGRTGFKVSDIGFGGGNLTNAPVLAAGLDMGINYIDTGEHYVNGQSERTVGQVLKGRDRKSIFLTTKLNLVFGPSTKEAIKQRALKCLERLGTDYVDCLMIHMMSTVDQVKHEPYHEVIRELKAEGKVHFSGLSCHGAEHSLAGQTKDDMEKMLLAAAEDGRFDVTLFVYNFIQREKGERILQACKEKNMGTTLMKTNPVQSYWDIKEELDQAKKAGRTLPEWAVKMFEEYKSRADQAEAFVKKYGLSGRDEVRDAATRFCLGHPDVHSVCPTINTFDQLEAFASLSGTRLAPDEKEMLADYEEAYGRFYCRHACGECASSCPHGVPVNTIMRYSHYFRAQGREKYALENYAALPERNASLCYDCAGHCEKSCPYGVPIQGLLVFAHRTLSLP